ncbi:MAG: FAD-dependent thymidylate synthase [Firmicutes bacterium]|nr:FAD-dependent thymidylate synthase [Bacillota bacterium]MCL5040676.1 FAD-dependent thymidylate synthase [Bacillota bacterium]
MKVIVLSHTPDPERTIAAAAKLAYSASGIDEIKDRLTQAEVERFLGQLLELGHLSPFEHASITFGIEGVSRVMLNQLVRHRIASFTQKSQRYVKERDFDFILPPSIEERSEARAIFLEEMERIQEAYNRLLALGIHQEDARYLLPNATESKIVFTTNFRELLHILELRTCQRAQWEIRRLAYKLLREARKAAPIVFRQAGPPCVTEGICREGKMSCGRWRRLKERHKKEAALAEAAATKGG